MRKLLHKIHNKPDKKHKIILDIRKQRKTYKIYNKLKIKQNLKI